MSFSGENWWPFFCLYILLVLSTIMYLGFSVLSEGCNCNVMSMLLPYSCSNYYTIFGLLFWQRLVDQRIGVSLFGAPPFLAPLHFSHLSFYVPSLQHENLFLAIYLFLPPSTLSFTLCSLHPSFHFSISFSSSPLFTFCSFHTTMARDHHHLICGQSLTLFSISLCFLIISSWTQLGLVTEGTFIRGFPSFQNGHQYYPQLTISSLCSNR